jgi:hypothetical protein
MSKVDGPAFGYTTESGEEFPEGLYCEDCARVAPVMVEFRPRNPIPFEIKVSTKDLLQMVQESDLFVKDGD